MARNKYPEQTIKKILDVSLHLFSQKGYDNTTIQDIVNELGMSKGAIYHHFKCKEEILEALGKHYYNDSTLFVDISQRSDLNGVEKIREVLRAQIDDQEKSDMDALTINIWKDPKLFLLSMEENLRVNASLLLPFLEEGIKDGSIREQDTKCASEILILLLNYWVLSPITGFESEALCKKIHYLRVLCDSLGIPIIDNELEDMTISYFKGLSKAV